MQEKFVRGALLLTLAGLAVKVLGSVSRVVLSRLLGGEGIGIYQLAYPLYLLFISLSAAGIPVALSILIARFVAQEDYYAARRVSHVAFATTLIMGLVCAALLYVVGEVLLAQNIIRDARALLALKALVPGVFCATALATFRGYFQGYQRMLPIAVSQVLEQLVRVSAMLTLVYYLLPHGLDYAAAGAAFGAVPGAIVGIMVLLFFYRRSASLALEQNTVAQNKVQTKVILKELIVLSLPVSCYNLTLPIVNGIDMLFVPGRLEVAGFLTQEATKLFGYLTGMALPLVMMSVIPTMSLTTSVVPAVAEAMTLGYKDKVREQVGKALRYCLAFTLPAAVGMFALREQLSILLYATAGPSSVIGALSAAIIFLGLQQVSTGLLQGLKQTVAPMVNMLLGAGVKAILVWYLVAQPAYNIIGAAWAADLSFALVAALNIFFLKQYLPIRALSKSCLKIALSSALMGLGAKLLYTLLHAQHMGLVLATGLTVCSAALLYGFFLLLTGEFTFSDLKALRR